MNWNEIGKRIRKQREYLGYTREVFAEKLDITPKFCSDIELGVKGMSVNTLCRIAEELNLSCDYILYGDVPDGSDPQTLALIKECPSDKAPYLRDIIKAFVMSTDK